MMQTFLSKVRSLFVRNSNDRDELESHIELLAHHFEQQGIPAEEARKTARRQFGNASLHQQSLRDQRRFRSLSNLARDLRFAARQLRKSPGFALTAILTLALSIGAATAIFSIVDGVLLKPLAYRDSGQLVVVWERVRAISKLAPYVGPNPRHEQVWLNQATGFSGLSIVQAGAIGVSLGNSDHPRFVGQVAAQQNLLSVLGVQPMLGRNFTQPEAEQKSPDTAMISYSLWQSLFHGDPDIIGKSISLAGVTNKVIGVLPQDFYFPKANQMTFQAVSADLPSIDVITPIGTNFSGLSWDGDYGDYVVLGRLKPAVTATQAQAQLDTLSHNVLRQFPANTQEPLDSGELATYVQPMKDVLVGKSTRSLWLLFAAVLSVLLIACVNLANAQLARSIARDRESAVRSALGASAWSLLQSSLAEVALLSLIGGTLGVVFAWLAVHRIASFIHLAVARTENLSVNSNVLALSVALSVGATLLFGLLPSLRLLRIKPQQALQSGTRSAGSRSGNSLRRWLIGLQIFACTTLLLVAGLFSKSLVTLLTSDKGFSADHVVTAEIDLEGAAFPSVKRRHFEDAVLDRLRTLPGVQSASLTNAMLLNGDSHIDPINQPNTALLLGNFRHISPDFFNTMGERIAEGRDFDGRDLTAKSIILSQATAKAVFPNQDPLGRHMRHDDKDYTVIGIVADARSTSLRAANPANMLYLDYWEEPPTGNFFLVRSEQDTTLLADTVRKTIWAVDPSVTIAAVHSLDAQISDHLAPERIQTAILAAFGGSALLLALLGIYGTLSYSVATRRQEIGIRMALGATRGNVYTVTLHEVLMPLTIGLALGWFASVVIGRGIASLLYGTTPTDPAVAISVIAIFLIAATVATIAPCRRAATIQPMDALRAE